MTDKFNPPEDWVWDENYSIWVEELPSGASKAYTAEGKYLQGFADPRRAEKINREGRVEGTRNKSKLMAVQNEIDTHALTAVEQLIAIGKNDYKALGYKNPLPAAVVVKANTVLLDKSIAAQKEKADFDDELNKRLIGLTQELEIANKRLKDAGIDDVDDSVSSVVSFKAKA